MYITEELKKDIESLVTSYLTECGKEVQNPLPRAVHFPLCKTETLQDQIKRLLRTELSSQAAAQGEETFEEANDFDVPDDEFDSEPNPTLFELADEEFYSYAPSVAGVDSVEKDSESVSDNKSSDADSEPTEPIVDSIT